MRKEAGNMCVWVGKSQLFVGFSMALALQKYVGN